MRQAKSTSLRGIIRNISDNNPFDAWIEIADDSISAGNSLSKTLLRLEGAGSWHIVRGHEKPDESNGFFRHKIKIQGLPDHLDHGESVTSRRSATSATRCAPLTRTGLSAHLTRLLRRADGSDVGDPDAQEHRTFSSPLCRRPRRPSGGG